MGRIRRPLRKFFTAGRGNPGFLWWWSQNQRKDKLSGGADPVDPTEGTSFYMSTEGETAGSQNITDASPVGATLSVVGNTNIQADGSVYFDGDGDWITIPHSDGISVANTNDITFEVEFKWDGDGDTTQSLFNKRDAIQAEEFRMTVNGGNIELITFISGSADVNLVGNTSLVADTWYNFKAVRSSGTWTIYLDDVADQTAQAEAGTPSANGADLQLGRSRFNSSREYKGFIRKAIVHNSALL